MKLLEIWIAQEDFDDPDPEGMVLGVGGFASWAMDDCGLEPGDFPEAALQSYWADRYLSEVMNGGHKQFARNTGLSPEAMINTERGLEVIGDAQALATFRRFKTFVADAAAARALMDDADYRNKSEAIREIDGQSPDIEDVRVRHAAWLRTLPNLKVMPAEKLEEKMLAFEQAL